MVGRLFSRFRQPKAQFDVEVVSGDLFPGGTVEIRTMFQSQQQFRVSEPIIGLVCTERYWKSDLISDIPRIHFFPGNSIPDITVSGFSRG